MTLDESLSLHLLHGLKNKVTPVRLLEQLIEKLTEPERRKVLMVRLEELQYELEEFKSLHGI